MARYIDAVKTADIISEKLNIPLGDLVDIFADIPTAEVVEAKQGYWKLCEDDSLICATEFVCSVCGESFCSSELTDKQMLEMMKYCSNCGADMLRTPKERGGGEVNGFRFSAYAFLEEKELIFSAIYFSEGRWWGMIDDKTKNEEYGTGSYAIDENTVKQL